MFVIFPHRSGFVQACSVISSGWGLGLIKCERKDELRLLIPSGRCKEILVHSPVVVVGLSELDSIVGSRVGTGDVN